MERKIILHQGVYKKSATTAEAVFMITGMTIGAGILGIPYVVAQAGLIVGLAQIFFLGFITLFLNLMIGEVAAGTNHNFQLPGLVGKYLGESAKIVMSILIFFGSLGALLAYVLGEGAALSSLFGGSKFGWSVIFWSIGSYFVWRGLNAVKKFEKILSFLVISIIVFLSLYFLPHVKSENLFYFDIGKIFLPYGVILFALSATPAIAESHALLPGRPKAFRRAVFIGTLIPIFVYILFALATVGVSGLSTTELVTVGLGQKFGGVVLILANVFAALAMGTGFVGLGTALKDSLIWDYKLPPWVATFLVIYVPLVLFLLGITSFITVLEIVGGLFISTESILLVLVYWKAKKMGHIKSGFVAHHSMLMGVPVLVVFSIVALISILKFVL